MTSLEQNSIIDGLNRYLKFKNRPLKLEYGYCHGLTLYWLHKMHEQEEQALYELMHKIATYGNKRLPLIEADIELFLSHIEWLQNSADYTKNTKQSHIDTLLETSRTQFISFIFTPATLKETLEKIVYNNEMVCLSGPSHTIGLYKRKHGYYIFDPNYPAGTAKKIKNIDQVTKEVIISLFKEHNFSTDILALDISVLTNDTKNANINIHDDLMNSIDIKNTKTNKGDSFLYLASESGNEPIVKQLLERGANPNQGKHLPLLIAAQQGYIGVVELLLENHANVSLTGKKNRTPLHLAAQNGHEEVITILLAYGANPLQLNTYKQSSLATALDHKEWGAATLLLSHIQSTDLIDQEQITFLKDHQQDILFAAKKQLPTLAPENQIYLQKNIKNIFRIKLKTGHKRFGLFDATSFHGDEINYPSHALFKIPRIR